MIDSAYVFLGSARKFFRENVSVISTFLVLANGKYSCIASGTFSFILKNLILYVCLPTFPIYTFVPFHHVKYLIMLLSNEKNYSTTKK